LTVEKDKESDTLKFYFRFSPEFYDLVAR